MQIGPICAAELAADAVGRRPHEICELGLHLLRLARFRLALLIQAGAGLGGVPDVKSAPELGR
jgi:hypothetical protein